jgi:hypothetical protein
MGGLGRCEQSLFPAYPRRKIARGDFLPQLFPCLATSTPARLAKPQLTIGVYANRLWWCGPKRWLGTCERSGVSRPPNIPQRRGVRCVCVSQTVSTVPTNLAHWSASASLRDTVGPIRLYERGLGGPSAGGGCGGVRRGQRNGPTSEPTSATCAVTKWPRGPIVGQLVDTFTTKSVLSPDSACATAKRSQRHGTNSADLYLPGTYGTLPPALITGDILSGIVAMGGHIAGLLASIACPRCASACRRDLGPSRDLPRQGRPSEDAQNCCELRGIGAAARRTCQRRVGREPIHPPAPGGRGLLLGLSNGNTDDFAPIELLPFRIVEQAAGDRKRSLPCLSFPAHDRAALAAEQAGLPHWLENLFWDFGLLILTISKVAGTPEEADAVPVGK